MTLEQVHDAMKRYNGAVAYGSECNAWQDFVADCYDRLGHAPWADAHWSKPVPTDFAEYWQEVAGGQSDAYVATNGARVES